jgi:hypothetical protein
MIKYALTQEMWTPEDIEEGEASFTGFVSDYEEDSFRTMVKVLCHAEPSESPLTISKNLWFSITNEPDVLTGEVEILNYHPATLKDARYMIKAWMLTH